MKVTINIDCTPAEARAFMGLPDIAPMQERLIKELEQRTRTTLSKMDPETLVRTWLPVGMQLGAQGIGQIQNLFSSIAGSRGTAPRKGKGDEKA